LPVGEVVTDDAIGYYKEYVHPTPGVRGAGTQRIVTGAGGRDLLYAEPLQKLSSVAISRGDIITMKPDLSAFIFYESDSDLNGQTDFTAVIPSKINNKKELLEALRSSLNLPQYFGYNWDALYECLRDLSWIKERRVLILHRDLPLLPRIELSIYLELLYAAVKDSEPEEDHQLTVAFPKQYLDSVADVLGAN
jgi:Barstar (barnase inhibitor)